MADTERPKFLKPDEEVLIGHPAPGDSAQRDRLDREYQNAVSVGMRGEAPGEVSESLIDHLVRRGRLKIGDLHDMLNRDVQRRNARH